MTAREWRESLWYLLVVLAIIGALAAFYDDSKGGTPDTDILYGPQVPQASQR